MINQLRLLIQDPAYFCYLIKKRFFQLSPYFANQAGNRSDSDDGEYIKSVNRALASSRAFNQFKRSPAYRHILEHVTPEQGAQYLDILESRNDTLLSEALSTVLRTDDQGKPIKTKYPNFEQPLSPTTLRYVKVASDCLHLFGKDLKHIAEIGCGYGGQCLVNDKLLNYQFATLFDLPLVNKLIKRYLDTHLMQGAFEVATINERNPKTYDLVISNYAFSELPQALQNLYIDKVLAKAKRGYLTMNSGIGGAHDQGKLSLAALKEKLPAFECITETPITSEFNYIIIWGHDKTVAGKLFEPKQISELN